MIRSWLFAVILLATFKTHANESTTFRLPTLDGLTHINGQIDFPEPRTKNMPLVVLVPGTGLFDRDAEFGNTGTEDDLVFRQLSRRLTENGFAVARYDYRGVSCSRQTVPPCPTCTTPAERRQHWIQSCFNNSIRATVTPENTREDILVVYDHAKMQPGIDPNRTIVFGHSEGSVNLSHLIKDRRIQPSAVVFMGGLAESLAGIIRWQIVGRIVDGISAMDTSHDGIISNDEIRANHASSRLNAHPLESLLSPNGSWVRSTLIEWREQEYRSTVNDALSKNDDEPFGQGGLVQASYRWWKMFFIDHADILSNLSLFTEPIVYCSGDNDAQADFDRQELFIRNAARANISIQRFVGKGHGLGDDPVFGPIAPASMNRLIEIFRSL